MRRISRSLRKCQILANSCDEFIMSTRDRLQRGSPLVEKRSAASEYRFKISGYLHKTSFHAVQTRGLNLPLHQIPIEQYSWDSLGDAKDSDLSEQFLSGMNWNSERLGNGLSPIG